MINLKWILFFLKIKKKKLISMKLKLVVYKLFLYIATIPVVLGNTGYLSSLDKDIGRNIDNKFSLPFPEAYLPELNSIIRIALDFSPEIIVSKAREVESKYNQKALRSIRIPKVRIDGHFVHQEEYRSSSPTHQVTRRPFSVMTISQPLYHWGALRSQIKQSEIQFLILREHLNESLRLLLLDTRSQYFKLLIIKNEIAFHEEELQLQKRILNISVQNRKKSRFTEDQYPNERLRLQEGELSLARLRQCANNLELMLKIRSGWRHPIILNCENIASQVHTLKAVYDSTIIDELQISGPIRSAGILIKNNELKYEKLNYTVLSSNSLPKINLVTTIQNDKVEIAKDSTSNRLLLQSFMQVNWQLFDGFQTRYQKLASRQRQLRIVSELKRAEKEIHSEVERSFYEWKLSCQEVSLRRDYLKLEASNLKRICESIKINRSIKNDLMQAQHNYNGSNLSLLRSEINSINNICNMISVYSEESFLNCKSYVK